LGGALNPNQEQEKPTTFAEYHEQNPQIYAAFKRFTFMLIQKGRKHYGARGIIELIRFNSIVSGNDGFKINNNYGAHYSRLFMKDFPQYDGFFKCRQMKNF
jgi:hypothetical protein